jgi:hypothetical protein
MVILSAIISVCHTLKCIQRFEKICQTIRLADSAKQSERSWYEALCCVGKVDSK